VFSLPADPKAAHAFPEAEQPLDPHKNSKKIMIAQHTRPNIERSAHSGSSPQSEAFLSPDEPNFPYFSCNMQYCLLFLDTN